MKLAIGLFSTKSSNKQRVQALIKLEPCIILKVPMYIHFSRNRLTKVITCNDNHTFFMKKEVDNKYVYDAERGQIRVSFCIHM